MLSETFNRTQCGVRPNAEVEQPPAAAEDPPVTDPGTDQSDTGKAPTGGAAPTTAKPAAAVVAKPSFTG
jgi:hypothetical protein